MKKIINILILGFAILYGCNEAENEYIFPKDYFPAYPQSYWVYSNGTTVKVSPGYHEHNYYEGLETTATSDVVYVPRIGDQFVYEYSITQNDNRVPLKKLLSEKTGEDWVVNYWEDGQMRRKVINKDTSVTLTSPTENKGVQTFDSCIVVIEYFKDTIEYDWQTKEIYAPKVGLIRQEIRRGEDSLINKELVRYYISEII